MEIISQNIVEYDIVSVDIRPKRDSWVMVPDLVKKVNIKINEGWSPMGGVSLDAGIAWQAIVKYNSPANN